MIGKRTDNTRRFLSPFLALTREERQILCLVLGLAILGLGARYWHRSTAVPKPAGGGRPAASQAQDRSPRLAPARSRAGRTDLRSAGGSIADAGRATNPASRRAEAGSASEPE